MSGDMPGKKEDKVAIFQLKPDKKYDHLRYKHYAELAEAKDRPRRENYDRVYVGFAEMTDTPYRIYQRFLDKQPHGYNGRAISTSDVIAVRIHGSVTYYYIDLGTLVVLPEFTAEKKKSPTKERDAQTEKTTEEEQAQNEKRWVKDTLKQNKKEIERADAEKKAAAEKAKQQQQQQEDENKEENKKKKDEIDI